MAERTTREVIDSVPKIPTRSFWRLPLIRKHIEGLSQMFGVSPGAFFPRVRPTGPTPTGDDG